jgi:anti-anti-sigma regulatory factor
VSRLDAVMTGDATRRRLTLAGRIDDTAPLAGMVAQLVATELVIDAGGVTFINSIGVRHWVRFLRALAAAGVRVRLEPLSEVMVTQLNLVPDMAAGATVAAVLAPYACDACGAEVSQRLDLAAHAAALRAGTPPVFPCAECGNRLVLADYPDRFFSFLRG